MFKNKILSTLLLSAVLLTSFSYSAKAAPSNSARTTSSDTAEVELKQIIKSYRNKNINFEDGALLTLNETMDISTYENVKVYNTEIIKQNNKFLTPIKEGTTFITYKIGDTNYVKEISVIKEDSLLGSNNFSNLKGAAEITTIDPNNGYTVCIDPGHGGSDPGAIGVNKIQEKYLTLSTSLEVAELLKAKGVTVYLTRGTDKYVSLSDRVKIMNSYYPDASISIHYNAATSPTANGIETYYYDAKTLSYELATELQSSLISYTSATNRGIKQGSFTVISKTRGYSALVEGGFLSNKTEASKIATDSYRAQIATAIVDGIMKFLQENVALQ